ncbi:MAG: UvrD-helicase domain-containing protein [Bacteroidales bacterium]|nr:UvrD-helicase domain-containing protein [Bacteroidales bacterium]
MEASSNHIFDQLNEAQAEAVRNIEGPCLIIAGAGAGKTRVLTCRIANAIACGAAPGEILALTFTKKAANEMKERIAALVGENRARWIWMGTFHSIFVRFLRDYAQELGYPEQFTIYDQSDSRAAVKQCIKELELDDKVYKPNEIASRISSAKNNLITASIYANTPAAIEQDKMARKGRICDIYRLYAQKCKIAGAMDFDDILVNTNILLRDFPEALDRIRSRFRYILVDEYQDTNFAQYVILKKLAAVHRNICVVGDDSQSIYGFRGARVENILSFAKDYPEAKIFRLEQNYRSTQTIVDAANSLIAKNEHRLEKTCFSKQGVGEKIEVLNGFTEQEESYLVAAKIVDRIYSAKAQYSDFAVLYRTNAQSRSIEEALRKRNLPYRIYAGFSFYDRAEVKDMLAYFRLAINPMDDEAFRRVVNFPVRGIGDTSLTHLATLAASRGISMLDAVMLPDQDLAGSGLKGAAIGKLRAFAAMVLEMNQKLAVTDAYELALEIGNQSGALIAFKADTSIEGLSKFQNVEALYNSIKDYVDEETENRANGDDAVIGDITVTLPEYVENITLLSAVERDGTRDDDNNKISLMTVHASKGLEFPYVFVIGLEENLFPSSIDLMPADIEEERRLFYVALTRAEKGVTLSYASNRMRWGKSESNDVSRFIREIDGRFLSGSVPSRSGARAASNATMGAAFGREYGSQRYGSPYGQGRSSYGQNNASGGGRPSWSYSSGKSSQPVRPVQSQPVRPASTSVSSRPASYTPTSGFTPDPIASLRVGQRVEHDRFGFGTILSFDGEGAGMKAVVKFEDGSTKTLLLKFAKLRVARD